MAKGSGNCAWGAGSIMLWKMMTGNVLRSYANFYNSHHRFLKPDVRSRSADDKSGRWLDTSLGHGDLVYV